MDLRLTATGVRKVFNRRTIFRDIAFTLGRGETLLVSGRNGSGKSTLVKIVAEVLTPSEGKVMLELGGSVRTEERYPFIGMVAPYLQIYEEFSAQENLKMSLALRGLPANPGRADMLLETVGLAGRKGDHVRTYSSGMKQRVKYAMALVHAPLILILDEPMSNLDSDGIAAVRRVMEEHCREGMLIVATNDLTDVPQFSRRVDLNGGR